MKKQPKLKDPNPLNFFNIRKLNTVPPHFEFISIPMHYNLQESIEKWILKNLKGRFYVGQNINLSTSNTLTPVLQIGFEEGKEMSYFTLACPHLKY